MRTARGRILLAVMVAAFASSPAQYALGAPPASMPTPKGTVALPAGFDPQQYTTKARITMPQAVGIALKKVPGRAAWAGLEDYGHFLFYSVEAVDAAGAVTMVTLDAGSGAVTAVEPAAVKEQNMVDVGEAPAPEDPEKGGVPKESPELSMVKGTVAIPEGTKDPALAYLVKPTLEQVMRSLSRKYRGKYMAISVYREKDTVMFGLELVQPGNKHIYFYVDPGTGKVLDTTRW